MIGSADQMLRPSRDLASGKMSLRCRVGRQTAGGSIMIRNAAAKPAISMLSSQASCRETALQNGHHDARRSTEGSR